MIYVTIVSVIAALAGIGMWMYMWLGYRQAESRAAAASQRLSEVESSFQARVQTAHQDVAKALEADRRALTAAQLDAARYLDTERRALAEAQSKVEFESARAAFREKELQGLAAKVAATAHGQADRLVESAQAQARQLVEKAHIEAKSIAGEAYELRASLRSLEQAAEAMKNTVEGYGDRYLLPSSPLLEALADEFSYTDAGKKLKEAARQAIRLIEDGEAAACDYAEQTRREGAIAFVLDAFNGKVDSILSRVKHDNFGTLSQQMRDAFALVNHGGEPFRNARILRGYLDVRLDELRWAEIAHQLRKQSQEEQRLLREAAREEEKARRDFERAQREAAREEEVIRQALAKAQLEAKEASDEQRASFTQKLDELEAKLKAAEEKNQRALSMAQQTRRGYVYVISNIGSFGENLYKIGLTRRLDPMDRIWELSDASVPFDFDVHAIILSEDAPALEHQMHRQFLVNQVNKVNHRKEFFAVSISEIRREFDRLGIQAQWTMAAEAAEYRETKAVERMIKDNPAALEAWKNRQLVLEAIDERVEHSNSMVPAGATASLPA